MPWAIVVLRKWLDPTELPAEVAISAVTLAELSAGPHEVRRNEEQSDYDEHAERARRPDILQREPRRRVADLMIDAIAIAIAEERPLFTTNPAHYKCLDHVLTVVPVTRPTVLHDR